jgi:DNA-binding transcriptional ArsR family regulator
MSLKDCRLRLLNRMLDLVWSQWTTLGISGNARLVEKWVLDPEALVLFTCTIGRYEPRIFDSMLEWLSFNQRLLNIQRLKTINRRGNFEGKQLLAAIAHLLMKPASRSKWERLSEKIFIDSTKSEQLFKLKDGSPHPRLGDTDDAFVKAGYIRQKFRQRKAVVQFNPDLSANLILKLRALFGLNSRCEIISYLLTHKEANPSEIAAVTGYSSKTIYNAISDMYMSGKLNKRVSGKESLYSLGDNSWEAFLCSAGRTAEWMDWPKAFRALEIIWMALDNPRLENEPINTIDSELRLAIHKILPQLQQTAPSISARLQRSIKLSELVFEELCRLLCDLIGFYETG